MVDPVDRLKPRRQPARGRQEADAQVGARPLEVQRVEAQLAEPLADAGEHVLALPPRRDGIGLVEPAHVQDLRPQPLERRVGLELRIDERRPGQRRARHRGPVRRARVDDLARLAQERQLVAPGALRVEVVEQTRRRRTGQPDPRGAMLAQREDPLAEPRRHVVERVLVGVEDAGALDVQVELRHVDVLRARAIRGGGDRARQLELARLGGDRDDLPALHVGGEAHDELGEAVAASRRRRRSAPRSRTRRRRPARSETARHASTRSLHTANAPAGVPEPGPATSAR